MVSNQNASLFGGLLLKKTEALTNYMTLSHIVCQQVFQQISLQTAVSLYIILLSYIDLEVSKNGVLIVNVY